MPATAVAATPSPAAPHRSPRTLALTCAAVAVGVGVHLLDGGTADLPAVAVAVPLLFVLFRPLTGRELGWMPIAGAQLAGQQVLHSLLTGTADPAAPASTLPADAFLYGHVVVAALVAVWLRHGERRTWSAARRAARAVVVRWRVLLALIGYRDGEHPAPPAPAPVHRPLVPGRSPLHHCVVRRGPPLPV